MFYIQQDEKIVLFDENLERLQNTIAIMPQYEGLEIKEVQEGYAIYDFKLMTVEEKEAKEAQKEAERIAMLSLTRGDVFRGLLMAKGVTRLMLRGMIETNEQLTEVQREMALIDFDEALNFYRGNALIDTVGLALGIESKQLDKFFEFNDYTYLISEPVVDNSDEVEEEKPIDTEVVGDEV